MIPHGGGTTRNISMSALHLWLPVVFFSLLAFASTFSLQLYSQTSLRVEELELTAFQLRAAAKGLPQLNTPDGSVIPLAETLALDTKYREEYKQSIDSITSKLNRIYELEHRIREVHDLPAKVRSSTDYVRGGVGGGIGGPSGSLGSVHEDSDELMRPSYWTYGMSEPSADLIIQEIGLRIKSLEELLVATAEKRERIACTPSILPSFSSRIRLTSRYGMRRNPFNRSKFRHHNGLDIAAPNRSPVVATAKGKVIRSTYDKYFGHFVEIDHGYGFRTLYGHLYKRKVEKGDLVSRGDTVGLLGNTGRSTGPHIHYEVHKNGKTIDPETTLVD